MGRDIAKQLAERGANVILVARNVEKLKSAMEYAQAAAKHPSSQRFHIISADVTTEAENARMLAEATSWNNGVTPEIVWANAGTSTPGLFVELKMETMRQQMDINYWAATYLAHLTLKAWLYPTTPYKLQEKGAKPEPPRHFIVTSSVLGFVNIGGYGGYSPAKAALKILLDGLRNEVNIYNGARRSKINTDQPPAPFDVVIQGIFPATITSPGHANEQTTKPEVTKQMEETDPDQSPAEAATAAIKGLEAGNFITTTSWLANVLRLTSLGNSPRNSVIGDLLGMWIAGIVWLFVGPDLSSKPWNWGKKKGMPVYKPNSI